MSETLRGVVRISGRVQGVGFRPFVYRLARELELRGWVRNGAGGVEAAVEGSDRAIGEFLARIESESPVLSRVEAIEFEAGLFPEELHDFRIAPSGEGGSATEIAPDSSICGKCLEELFDPSDRRYRHPFISCADCGPRHTIMAKLPYDRRRTSMAKFSMCEDCRKEYLEPSDRRFHAQGNACNSCGPGLSLLDEGGIPIAGDPVENALNAILSGKILAVRGMGGFHLVCDARNRDAVSRLRASKRRQEKPFAVMVAGSASISPFAMLGEQEKRLIESRGRPIVLLGKKENCDEALSGIAPGMGTLGVMLPCATHHYLLFHEAAGRPEGLSWLGQAQPLVLVATSANRSGEPIVAKNEEALERLDADFFLVHDREIVSRCDDSVMRWNKSAPQFARRARGYAPAALKLPFSGPPLIAFGPGYKSTVCLTRGDVAFVSQHVGDLDNPSACMAMEKTAAHLLDMLEIAPQAVAHDMHPDFHSTRFAFEFAERLDIPSHSVQHHHAHVAAVMAEHGLNEPVIGLALDGVGLGADGGIWGGELLLVDDRGGFERLGHLAEIVLPGGDIAAREPWRMAAGALFALGRTEEIPGRYGRKGEAIGGMIARKLNSPMTSSMGRWFDAAAGLLGVIEKTDFDGHAAMRLEALAKRKGPVPPLENGFRLELGVLDLYPLLDALADIRDEEYGAALFHSTLVEGLKSWLCDMPGVLPGIVFSGGCFANSLLSDGLAEKIEKEGFAVFQAEKYPPNDGGISLGQAYVALQRENSSCA